MAASFWACAQAEVATTQINDVELIEGSLSSFVIGLRIQGRGFLDLDQVRIFSELDDLEFRAQVVVLESPNVLRARFTLTSPLPPGSYGVSIWRLGAVVSERNQVFTVEVTDGGVLVADGGVADSGDSGVSDPEPPDAGQQDAGQQDAGLPDTGLQNDAGVAVFPVDAQYRRWISVSSSVAIADATTVILSIDHRALVDAGKAQLSGDDLWVFQQDVALDYQFADRFALGTPDLKLIVRLAQPIAAGTAAQELALYYGNPQVNTSQATDQVFEFSERFEDLVTPNNQDPETSWRVANRWRDCTTTRAFDRPQPTPSATEAGAHCVHDDANDDFHRQTLATPRLEIRGDGQRPPNTRYEMSFWLAGRMVDGERDILYLSHFTDNESFSSTLPVTMSEYSGYPVDATLTFQDSDNQDRTVSGWRLPADQPRWWAPVRFFFVPSVDRPSMHFRYVSAVAGGNATDSFTVLDDLWIRLAPNPAPSLDVGPEEER